MPTYAVMYRFTDDTAARDEHRPRHRDFLVAQFEAGSLKVSGPFGPEEEPGSLLVFEADSVEDITALMDTDPFMRAGVVAERRIRRWDVVFGQFAR